MAPKKGPAVKAVEKKATEAEAPSVSEALLFKGTWLYKDEADEYWQLELRLGAKLGEVEGHFTFLGVRQDTILACKVDGRDLLVTETHGKDEQVLARYKGTLADDGLQVSGEWCCPAKRSLPHSDSSSGEEAEETSGKFSLVKLTDFNMIADRPERGSRSESNAEKSVTVLAEFRGEEGRVHKIQRRGTSLSWTRGDSGTRLLTDLGVDEIADGHFQLFGPFGAVTLIQPEPGTPQRDLVKRLAEVVLKGLTGCKLRIKATHRLPKRPRLGYAFSRSMSDVSSTGRSEIASFDIRRLVVGDAVGYYSRPMARWYETVVTRANTHGHFTLITEIEVAARPGFLFTSDGCITTLRQAGQGGLAVPALDGKLSFFSVEEIGAFIAFVAPRQRDGDTAQTGLEIDLDIPMLRAAADSGHTVWPWFYKAIKLVSQGRDGEAQCWLKVVHTELRHDRESAIAAFSFFDRDGDGSLTLGELKAMMKYVGMPVPADIKSTLSVIDCSGNELVELEEFLRWVTLNGGTTRLFESRRKEIEGIAGSNPDDIEKASLQEAGIDKNSLSFWSPTLAISERQAVVDLIPDQRHAIHHIRKLSYSNHKKALPILLERAKELDYDDADVYVTLDWIREKAPCLIHLQLDRNIDGKTLVELLAADDHYRNQFETHTSGGLNNLRVRKRWEHDLFGSAYDETEGPMRVKYGVINVFNDPRGIASASQYGDSYLCLKDVRLRTTFSPCDSGGISGDRLATCDHFAHDLLEYSDGELKALFEVAMGKAEWKPSTIIRGSKYKEAQYHGMISFAKHVRCVVAHKRHQATSLQPVIESMCRKHGIELRWHDGFKEETDSCAPEFDGLSGYELFPWLPNPSLREKSDNIFGAYDEDDDGFLSCKEFGNYMAASGLCRLRPEWFQYICEQLVLSADKGLTPDAFYKTFFVASGSSIDSALAVAEDVHRKERLEVLLAAQKATELEYKHLLGVLSKYDHDKELDESDFATLFRDLGFQSEYISSYFKAFDIDESGQISFKELAAGLTLCSGADIDATSDFLIRVFGVKRPGVLLRAEFEAAVEVAIRFVKVGVYTSLEPLAMKILKMCEGSADIIEWKFGYGELCIGAIVDKTCEDDEGKRWQRMKGIFGLSTTKEWWVDIDKTRECFVMKDSYRKRELPFKRIYPAPEAFRDTLRKHLEPAFESGRVKVMREFAYADENKDGELSLEELKSKNFCKKLLRTLVPATQFGVLIKQLDSRVRRAVESDFEDPISSRHSLGCQPM